MANIIRLRPDDSSDISLVRKSLIGLRECYPEFGKQCDGEKCEDLTIWLVNTVYRQIMQFDRIRRKAIDDYINSFKEKIC